MRADSRKKHRTPEEDERFRSIMSSCGQRTPRRFLVRSRFMIKRKTTDTLIENRAGGENQVNGFKWTGNTRVLLCIIAVLLFVTWFASWLKYY